MLGARHHLVCRCRWHVYYQTFLWLTIATATTSLAFSVPVTALEPDAENNFPSEILEYDSYNGVILKFAKLDEKDPLRRVDLFQKTLEKSLQTWTEGGKRGVWVYLPPEMSNCIPVCVSNGFDFHFAKKGLLLLTKWLPSTPSRLPLGPTHQVGVGCLVTRRRQQEGELEMLVVQEQTGPAAKHKLWKMPTGLLDPGETIREAAVRELKEETGLDGTMHRILTFRQAPGDRGSDLFFVCWMQLHDENQACVRQVEEISDIRWMPVTEFASQKLWQSSPVYLEMNRAMMRAIQEGEGGMEEKTMPVGFRSGTNTIYIPAKM